jgi:hypothetical protein
MRLRRLGGLCALAFVCAGVPLTGALLTDQGTAATVDVTAGSVNVPTGLTLSDTGSAVRVAWTPPAAGITPQSYDILARPSAGSYAGTPTATSATSPFDDATPADCSTWFYKVRSSHANLKSAYTPETSLLVDRTAPTVNAAHVVFTAGPTPVADYVRAGGGAVDVYADVTDACQAAGTLAVTFDLSALGAASNVPATFGSYTPIAGGATYDFKASFTLAGGVVANGATKSWSVTATDPSARARTTAGTAITGDGVGPVLTSAEMVSAYTNFYDATLAAGEIPSDGTAKASGAYVYADLTDAGSGVYGATANLSAGGILPGTTALPLASGSYTTYAKAAVWPWRSAATVIATGLADGNRNFTVTGSDKVGNAATSANQTVAIDDTPIATGTASCTNAGNANNFLGAGDTTDFNFGDTVYPGSVKANWTGTALTATAILRNSGSNDYFDLNTDFGVTVFSGTTAATAWSLAANWVGSNTNFAGSTLSLAARTTLRLAYQGGSVADQSSTAQATFGTGVRDAAGNQITAAFSKTCVTTAW